MYAVVRRYRATNVPELSRRVQDEFVPQLRDIPGFVAYYVIDGGGGEIASVTVCEDQAGEEESTRRAAAWVGEAVSDFLEGPPDVLGGEVTASA
jgi:hypothetical protein